MDTSQVTQRLTADPQTYERLPETRASRLARLGQRLSRTSLTKRPAMV